MNGSLSRARLGFTGFAAGIVCMLMGAALPIQSASAAEAAAANPDAGKRFATVLRVRGEVVASGGSAGKERTLREGDAVYVGERVRAPALAEAVLKTEDAGFLAIRPNTDFVAERYAAEDKPTDNFTVRLLTGSLRLVSGWLGRTNRAGSKVVTPTATIGIRGTDHEPYVLSAELAASTSNREGTYDKVNRGGTTMEVGENKLDIDAGRVGFVRAAGGKGFKERALLTILMPVLLDKVPGFYVPGEFDPELDKLSEAADQDSQRALEQRRKGAAPAAQCAPGKLARAWLKQLDGAIVKRDAKTIVDLFAADVAVRANVKDKDGALTGVDLSRDEMAQSTVAAMKGLSNYKQRRVTTDAAAEGDGCTRIAVKSVVIEQGRQSGKPYRFEAVEEYVLELRAGKWLAVKAVTTQK
jgi:hypothetical protein